MTVEYVDIENLMPWICWIIKQRLDEAVTPEDLFALLDHFPEVVEAARNLQVRDAVLSA
jgi:hypothetical protein